MGLKNRFMKKHWAIRIWNDGEYFDFLVPQKKEKGGAKNSPPDPEFPAPTQQSRRPLLPPVEMRAAGHQFFNFSRKKFARML